MNKATHSGIITINGHDLIVSVLDNDIRIITKKSLIKILGEWNGPDLQYRSLDNTVLIGVDASLIDLSVLINKATSWHVSGEAANVFDELLKGVMRVPGKK